MQFSRLTSVGYCLWRLAGPPSTVRPGGLYAKLCRAFSSCQSSGCCDVLNVQNRLWHPSTSALNMVTWLLPASGSCCHRISSCSSFAAVLVRASHASHRCGILLHVSHALWSVCVSVGTPVSPAKTDEPIEMPFLVSESCRPKEPHTHTHTHTHTRTRLTALCPGLPG